MIIQLSNVNSGAENCPYCGKPYKLVTIPALWDIPERTIRSQTCGCDGELEAERKRNYYERVKRREQVLRKTGIPKIYWEYEQDSTYLHYIDDPGGVFFFGDAGRGKTVAAACLTKAWMNENPTKRAVFTDAMSLFGYIRQAYDDGDSEREAIYHFTGADLLVFDDLGKGRPSEWSLERVEAIINERYEEGLPCIFTSQWSGDELVDRLADGGTYESAEAIMSRIGQRCEVVKMDGPDRRLI